MEDWREGQCFMDKLNNFIRRALMDELIKRKQSID